MTTLADLRMNIRQILRTPPPALKYVLPGLLAGTVGSLIAPGGLGKTTLLTQICGAIACGQPVLGGALDGTDRSPAKVALFLAEETLAVMHHKVHEATEQLASSMASRSREDRHALLELLDANLGMYPMGGHGSLVRMGDGTKEYRLLVELCKGARLIVFDPLRQFHEGDEIDTAFMTAVVMQFQRLARETGSAVLLAHHANRSSISSGTGEQVGASRGCTALTDGVRWQANLSPVSESLANEFGIDRADLRQFVRFDISKSNYSGPRDTVVLRKAPQSGMMSLWVPNQPSTRAVTPRKRAGATQ
ncbi:AAA family ATPase [Cupriavidus lacunae]|uniref:DNA helicase n=1 Tax=Cupriavidus lacunae TaxID=2666307 RepID=A0A370NU80_9BURK|nr:AAA family ATPase [Cupriavidus lacunae]RDK09159.1 DNA helicase [Cupriavidus lacunae]